VHGELEHELATWKGAEAAVLFPTGFAANLGVLSTFAGPGVLVASDELNHASIIDGCRLSRGTVEVFPHGDVARVDALLKAWPGRALVVTDSVFSMDGDVAPVDDLIELCDRHGALLVLDEAHAVLGPDTSVHGADVLHVGTLSKTLGSLGGFVAGRRRMVDLLVNRARPYIFTTASTPADTAAALAALGVLRSSEGAALVARLRVLVERVRPGHPSPIVPVVLGEEEAALAASAALLEMGVLVPAIRPPTVPVGTSRLRVALSAAHTDEQIDLLLAGLATYG
jgi:7-keto-8-aminopelargonate synthetase-like enzyme